jgi:hypothetical protein
MTGAYWLSEIGTAIRGVAIAVTPLVLLFLLAQVFLLKLPTRQVADVLIGTAIAAIGLILFLAGVGIGFLPMGRALGESLAELNNGWVLTLAAGGLGFVTAWGEPAVRILAQQVESASNGSIRGAWVVWFIGIGVAIWVALGMVRIRYEIPILYLLVPGYGLAIAMMTVTGREFVAIAVDAGGVATGPLANSFLLAFALGASSAMGQNPILHGFGLVALIALAPIIAVLSLGLLIKLRIARGRRDAAAKVDREHRAKGLG